MIRLEVWLYGPLARYAPGGGPGYARVALELPAGSKMRDLLERLGMPVEEKAITFVNGQLTDMPGLGADLDRELKDGDRVGLLHRLSMWPYQYRHGGSESPELEEALKRVRTSGLVHYSTERVSGLEEKEVTERA